MTTDRRRCRLCVAFPPGQLRSLSQVAPLFPTASSLQLPRSVDCEFATPAAAADALARLQATAVGEDRQLVSAELCGPRTAAAAGGHSQRRVLKDLTRLYVRGVPRTGSVEQLQAVFPDAVDVSIPDNNRRGNNGYAFVQFADAKTAARHLGRRQLQLLGKRLTVGFALERDGSRAAAESSRFAAVEVDLQEARAGRVQEARERDKQQHRWRQQRQAASVQKRHACQSDPITAPSDQGAVNGAPAVDSGDSTLPLAPSIPSAGEPKFRFKPVVSRRRPQTDCDVLVNHSTIVLNS